MNRTPHCPICNLESDIFRERGFHLDEKETLRSMAPFPRVGKHSGISVVVQFEMADMVKVLEELEAKDGV